MGRGERRGEVRKEIFKQKFEIRKSGDVD